MDRSGTIIFFILFFLVFAFIILITFLAVPPLIIGPGPVGSLPTSSNFVIPKIGETYFITDVETGLYLGLEEVQDEITSNMRNGLDYNLLENIPIRLSEKPVPWTIEDSQDKKQNVINCKISGGANGDIYSEFDEGDYIDTFLGEPELEKNYTLSGTAFSGYLMSPSSRTEEDGTQLSVLVFQMDSSSLVSPGDISGKTGRLRFSLA